jgi:hypothetical protein
MHLPKQLWGYTDRDTQTDTKTYNTMMSLVQIRNARCGVVIMALRYKPEDREFYTPLDEFLNVSNPSGRTRPSGLLGL